MFPSLGIDCRIAENDSAAAIDALIDENTRAVFCESIGNPAGNVVDLEALAEVAHKHGVPLIVDNTVASPCLIKPISYGADIVIHSLTKYIGGHGNSLGGMIVDSGKFDWVANKDPLSLRMERHTENAMAVAEYLENDSRVDWVNSANFQTPCEYWRCEIPCRPSSLDDPSPADRGRVERRECHAGNAASVHRYRAHRRHHR